MSAKRLMSAVMVALLVGAVTYFAVAWITGSETRETAAGDDERPEHPTLVPEGLTPGPTPELQYPTDWNHEVSDALATEAAKPRFDGDLAGIHIDGNGDHQRPWFQCPEAEEYVFDIGAAGGTAYDILSEGLPEGVSEGLEPSAVVMCQGQPIGSSRSLRVDDRYTVFVTKLLRPVAWSDSHGSADRTYEVELGGQPVVVVAPLLPSGTGDPVVMWATPVEGGVVMTWVGQADIPLPRLLEVAEVVLK